MKEKSTYCENNYQNDIGKYDNPRYDKAWYGSKKKFKKEELLLYIEELENANEYLENKLSSINHECCQTRESYFYCEEHWLKDWEELTDFEKNLYWSGYMHQADEINEYFFKGVVE